MLDLCINLIKNNKLVIHDRIKENIIVFQDFNTIIVALINYHRSISPEQYTKIAQKMYEIMVVIEQNQSSTRTDPALIKDLKELVNKPSIGESDVVSVAQNVRNNKKSSTQSPIVQSSKITRANLAVKDDFVVIDSGWKFEPDKLTEHQREKIKKRPSDIPALYNDLSQSQDSSSIQGWTPKATSAAIKANQLETINSKSVEATSEENVEKLNENDAANSADDSSRAVNGDESIAKEKKLSHTAKTNSNEKVTVKKSTRASETIVEKKSSPTNGSEEFNVNRRITREQNRIQVDANSASDGPLDNSLTPGNRLTRSTINRKVSNEIQTERRKTRSESTKLETSINPFNKTKTPRASLTNSTLVSVRQKHKSAKGSTSPESEPVETTAKRTRITRQTRSGEAIADSTTASNEKQTSIVSNFVDKAQLKINKLPKDLTQAIQIEDEIVKVEIPFDINKSNTEFEDKQPISSSPEPISSTSAEPNTAENMDTSENIENSFPNTVDTDAKTDDAPTENCCSQKDEEVIKNADCTKTPHDTDALETMETEPALDKSDEIDKISSSQCSNEENLSDTSKTEQISRMSTLIFDELSPSKLNPNDSILTSPQIDVQRNLEFLNDTLNISPIVSDAEHTIATDTNVSSKTKTNATDKVDDKHDTNEQTTFATDVNGPSVPVQNDILVKIEVKSKDSSQLTNNVEQNLITSSPVVALTSISTESAVADAPSLKQYKTSLSISASTPIQSHHSPVSSKFSTKTQLMGRGAQLLKMINSNKITKPSSPTMVPAATSDFSNTGMISSSPTIKQLQTAPMCDNLNTTPEPSHSKHYDRSTSRTDNGDFLTFSSVLPSPYESPGISILKRKMALNDTDDEIAYSPAPKRKRVSFNFPLSQTKEYLVEEEFTPYYLMPSNHDSPNRDTFGNITSPANRLKNKFKRNKNRSDSMKALAKFPQYSSDSDSLTINNRSSDINMLTSKHHLPHQSDAEDEVSVKHLKECINMDTISHREQQKRESELCTKTDGDNGDNNSNDVDILETNPATLISANESNSDDDSSTESNIDDTETDVVKLQEKPSLNSFTDAEIVDHLLAKYSPNNFKKNSAEVLNEKSIRLLTNILSSQMLCEKSIENLVLDELAEKHSTAFLEHTIMENICSVICERLTAKSTDGLTDYVTDKINNDQTFANAVLNKISQKSLQKHVFNATASQNANEQQQFFEELLVTFNRNCLDKKSEIADVGNRQAMSQTIYDWIGRQISQFKLSSDEFEELYKIYILKKMKE